MFSPHYKPLSERPTVVDKLLAATLLKIIPNSVRPNHLTVFRFLTLPFIVYLLWTEEYLSGMILFVVSASTDMLDGALARVRGQITEWGKIFDPMADKLLIGLSAIIIVGRFVSMPLALVMVFLEVLIIIGAIWRRYLRGEQLQAKKVGKVKMILQSVGLLILLLGVALQIPTLVYLSYYVLITAVLFAFLSLAVYQSI